MKKIFIILVSFLVLSITFCKKKTTSTIVTTTSYVNGTLIDQTGFDGCAWVIELDAVDQYGNKYLEPINLQNFNFNKVSGQRVKFNYIEKTDRFTPCMLGTIVELTMICNK
jgi:hypothetical protein